MKVTAMACFTECKEEALGHLGGAELNERFGVWTILEWSEWLHVQSARVPQIRFVAHTQFPPGALGRASARVPVEMSAGFSEKRGSGRGFGRKVLERSGR